MCTEANSEGPDEMPHNAAFHQGLHCLLRQKRSSEKEIQYILGKFYLVTPQYMQWTNPSLLFQTRRKSTVVVYKGLN